MGVSLTFGALIWRRSFFGMPFGYKNGKGPTRKRVVLLVVGARRVFRMGPRVMFCLICLADCILRSQGVVRRSPFWTVLATVLFVQEGRGLLELLARAPRSEGSFTVPRKDTASVFRTWFHDLTGLAFVEGIVIGS